MNSAPCTQSKGTACVSLDTRQCSKWPIWMMVLKLAHPPSVARLALIRAFVSLYSAENYGNLTVNASCNVCNGKRLQGRVGIQNRCAVRS